MMQPRACWVVNNSPFFFLCSTGDAYATKLCHVLHSHPDPRLVHQINSCVSGGRILLTDEPTVVLDMAFAAAGRHVLYLVAPQHPLRSAISSWHTLYSRPCSSGTLSVDTADTTERPLKIGPCAWVHTTLPTYPPGPDFAGSAGYCTRHVTFPAQLPFA